VQHKEGNRGTAVPVQQCCDRLPDLNPDILLHCACMFCACRLQLMLLQMRSQLAGPRGPGARLATKAREAQQQGSLLLLLLLLPCCRSRSSCSWLAYWQSWQACLRR
jgi:hypothetical protein